MSYLVTLFTIAGLNAILAVSVYMTLATGQFSLAQVGFWAIGAYGTAALTTLYGWALLPALLACAAGCFVIGIALGYPCLRVKGIYLALATLGFSECARVFFLNFTWQVPVQGVPTGPAAATGFRNVAVLTQPWHVAAFLVVLIVLLVALERSRYGKMLGAIQEDEAAASAMGIDVVASKLLVFALGAAVAAVGGGLYACYMSFITSGDFGFSLTMLAVLYVGAGGLGTFWGPVFGAVLLTLLPEVIRPLQEYRMIFYGLLVTAIVLVRPRGLIDENAVHWLGRVTRRRSGHDERRRLQGGQS
ncbi:branched-chain amino acid ABC transporter permease [Caballeronia sp. LZ043]|uniref:branched-chain amino acid ABC transporter permease n=1 Tax=Caballeronia sp. LZ043 TaxID=3038569 RepID=UPI00285F5C2E|nr:branched-chain amino acid ABC transporter permease [Caballeronia sp. LZ043]MDR5823646.1 branched-chain amino acid ABC transporter permease [Caballeronia sp. LZ043]